MSLIADVAADQSGVKNSNNWKPAPAVLSALATALGPEVTYGFAFDGLVTTTKSFDHRPRVYAMVLDKGSSVDGHGLTRTIDAMHLHVPVLVLRELHDPGGAGTASTSQRSASSVTPNRANGPRTPRQGW